LSTYHKHHPLRQKANKNKSIKWTDKLLFIFAFSCCGIRRSVLLHQFWAALAAFTAWIDSRILH
jgi:hypothetical protein